MMVFDESAYLGGDGGAVPAHQQHLADGPARQLTPIHDTLEYVEDVRLSDGDVPIKVLP